MNAPRSFDDLLKKFYMEAEKHGVLGKHGAIRALCLIISEKEFFI